MSDSEKKRKPGADGDRTNQVVGSRVPAGRLERLARLGLTAGKLTAGALAAGTRRFASGLSSTPADLLLTAANAERLAAELAQMRGAAMKLGQMLSLEADVTLPAPFAQALAILQSEGTFMPLPQLRRVLGRELGRGWQEKFASFDETPIAAASIGQVHRARTHDGREIVLKVQFPGVAKSIASDVDNLGVLLRLTRLVPAGFEMKPLLEAVKSQLKRETDYLGEAQSMARYRSLIEDTPFFVVPEPLPELSTSRVLAMTYEEGVGLPDLWEGNYSAATRDKAGKEIQRLVLRELFEFGFMQSDPNFANFLWQPETRKIVLLDFGSMVEIEPSMVDGYATLCRGAMSEDREEILVAMKGLSWVAESDPADAVQSLVDLALLSCEPLRHRGRFDFGTTDLAVRARDAGVDLAVGKGFFRPPPPAGIFLHRKLGGTYLVCAQLGARVDCRSLLAEALKAR